MSSSQVSFPPSDAAFFHQPASKIWRGWPIAYWGIRLTLKSIWTQIMLFFAWLTTLGFASLLLVDYFGAPLDFMTLRDFLHWQQREVVLFTAIIGAGLIASDMEERAILLYFCRPISRWQYLIGKLSIVGFYFFWMILAPALTVLILEVALRPKATIANWSLFLTAIGCSLTYSTIILLTLGLFTLGISALASNRKVACVLWIGFYFLSEVVYLFFTIGTHRYLDEWAQWMQLISYRRNIEIVGDWIFQPWTTTRPPVVDWYYPAAILTLISALSVRIIFKRIQKETS
ncbi:MAG: hypothetical protein D6805_09370 [Planctomycetota bacterium]|nr:MAG: hypothetical protein D6805_09370 [Planctomycetota bacterium]